MTLEEIQEMVDKDVTIDDTELDIESKRTPELHNKYLKIYNNFNLMLKKARADRKRLYREKWEYYSGKSEIPFEYKVLRQDLGIYLDADEDLLKLDSKVEYLETVVNYLDSVIKQITRRGFEIKAAIDWKKFVEGIS